MTVSWEDVARDLRERCMRESEKPIDEQHLDAGQRASILWIADRLPHHGVVLADEVGTGKTRIACAVVHAVVAAGGRVAVVVPHGLMHQWRTESDRLIDDGPQPKSFTTLKDFFDEVGTEDETWEKLAPRPDAPEWCLISHNFRAPSVGSRAREWRYALPPLTELHVEGGEQAQDGRTRWGKLAQENERLRELRTQRRWTGMNRIASATARRVKKDRKLRKRLQELPLINATTWDNQELAARFTENGPGREITEAILGHWLGDFDLLVIDEAHKGRGEVEQDGEGERRSRGSVLSRLLACILRPAEGSRRLCLTATPMELELEQWLQLLDRAGCGLVAEVGKGAVGGLRDATLAAAIAPDETTRLSELCRAAREFATTLEPFVTRRRRTSDPEVQRFAARAPDRSTASHPHRHHEKIEVPWSTGADSEWAESLFAAECMSRSMRGLPRAVTSAWPRAVQDAYTKLAAGHVSVDLVDDDAPIPVPPDGEVDEAIARKVRRTAYWYGRLREARAKAGRAHKLDEHLAETEHPRLLAAVEEIERWTNADANREKVLVFGVFLQPLKLLRDVLDARHLLRAADAGRPVPRALSAHNSLLRRQLERMQGDLSGKLRGVNDPRQAIQESHAEYERLRERVRDHARKSVAGWLHDPALFGAPTNDPAFEKHLRDAFVAFVVEQLLASSDVTVDAPRVETLGQEFISKRLLPLLGDGAQDDREHDGSARIETVERVLADEGNQVSSFARLLHGGTDWDTRRYLQAAFNREGAPPWVLIAQSQVGREGLNLHEQCRVVLQFHAEWNPAVLEQQIGRVDRKGSLWEHKARAWLDGGGVGDPPYIEVRQLVLEGTYDAYQWQRVGRRQQAFDASLFGTLLPAEAWARVPDERKAELIAAAPDFSPTRHKPSTRG